MIPDESPVDMDSALLRFDHDIDFLKKMFRKFLERVPEQLRGLMEALSAGDAEKMQSCAHGIKGSSGILSATRVYSLATDLEDMGLRRDLTGAQRLMEELKTELDRLERFVEGL